MLHLQIFETVRNRLSTYMKEGEGKGWDAVELAYVPQ